MRVTSRPHEKRMTKRRHGKITRVSEIIKELKKLKKEVKKKMEKQRPRKRKRSSSSCSSASSSSSSSPSSSSCSVEIIEPRSPSPASYLSFSEKENHANSDKFRNSRSSRKNVSRDKPSAKKQRDASPEGPRKKKRPLAENTTPVHAAAEENAFLDKAATSKEKIPKQHPRARAKEGVDTKKYAEERKELVAERPTVLSTTEKSQPVLHETKGIPKNVKEPSHQKSEAVPGKNRTVSLVVKNKRLSSERQSPANRAHESAANKRPAQEEMPGKANPERADKAVASDCKKGRAITDANKSTEKVLQLTGIISQLLNESVYNTAVKTTLERPLEKIKAESKEMGKMSRQNVHEPNVTFLRLLFNCPEGRDEVLSKTKEAYKRARKWLLTGHIDKDKCEREAAKWATTSTGPAAASHHAENVSKRGKATEPMMVGNMEEDSENEHLEDPAQLEGWETLKLLKELIGEDFSPESSIDCEKFFSWDHKTSTLPISQNLVTDWSKIIINGLDSEVKEDLLNNNLPPENFPHLQVPLLNPDLRQIMNGVFLKKDDYHAATQRQIGCALSTIGRAVTILLECKELGTDKHECLIDILDETAQMLADLYHATFDFRKSYVVPGLAVLANRHSDEDVVNGLLFGESFAAKWRQSANEVSGRQETPNAPPVEKATSKMTPSERSPRIDVEMLSASRKSTGTKPKILDVQILPGRPKMVGNTIPKIVPAMMNPRAKPGTNIIWGINVMSQAVAKDASMIQVRLPTKKLGEANTMPESTKKIDAIANGRENSCKIQNFKKSDTNEGLEIPVEKKARKLLDGGVRANDSAGNATREYRNDEKFESECSSSDEDDKTYTTEESRSEAMMEGEVFTNEDDNGTADEQENDCKETANDAAEEHNDCKNEELSHSNVKEEQNTNDQEERNSDEMDEFNSEEEKHASEKEENGKEEERENFTVNEKNCEVDDRDVDQSSVVAVRDQEDTKDEKVAISHAESTKEQEEKRLPMSFERTETWITGPDDNLPLGRTQISETPKKSEKLTSETTSGRQIGCPQSWSVGAPHEVLAKIMQARLRFGKKMSGLQAPSSGQESSNVQRSDDSTAIVHKETDNEQHAIEKP